MEGGNLEREGREREGKTEEERKIRKASGSGRGKKKTDHEDGGG